MTSKEALQDLRWNVSMSQDLNYRENNALCDIIEKDLDLLEKHKKIEEKLGIDFITLGKTILQGYIFVREHNTEEKEIVAEDVRPNFLNHTFDFKEPRKEIGKGRPFSRIEKTWALTREELENEIQKKTSNNRSNTMD